MKQYFFLLFLIIVSWHCVKTPNNPRYPNLPFDKEQWQTDKEFRVWMLCEAQNRILGQALSEHQIFKLLGTPDRRQRNQFTYDIPTGAEFCHLILKLNRSFVLDTVQLQCDYSFDENDLVKCDK